VDDGFIVFIHIFNVIESLYSTLIRFKSSVSDHLEPSIWPTSRMETGWLKTSRYLLNFFLFIRTNKYNIWFSNAYYVAKKVQKRWDFVFILCYHCKGLLSRK